MKNLAFFIAIKQQQQKKTLIISLLKSQALKLPIIVAKKVQNLILTYTYSEKEHSITLLVIKNINNILLYKLEALFQ